MRSAILFRMPARKAGVVLPQASAAACAASSARLMSASCERAAWVKGRPVIGETLSKYWPPSGAVNLPLMKLS